MSWEKDREDRLRNVEKELASQSASNDERFKTLFANMGTLTGELAALVKETNRLNVNIETERLRTAGIQSRLCSAPDTCLELKPKVERHEQILNQQRGGWKALAAVAAVCVTAGSFIGWIIAHAPSWFKGGHQ